MPSPIFDAGHALAQITDPGTLTDEEEQSLHADHILIAAANGAANRLAQLEADLADHRSPP